MSRLSDYFADYVPTLYIDYECGEQYGEGYIKDLGLGFSSEYLIEKFHKIQEDNPQKEYNARVGLTLKEAIKEKFGSEIDHIYISDEDTGDIFIDEQ